jgi:hypothetical protein
MNFKQQNVYVFFGGLLALVLTVIIAFWNYKINENNLMSQNIQNAMSKGIDPLSVRCTYAADTDNICLAYALRTREHNSDIPVPIRK